MILNENVATESRDLVVPELSLILLIGPSGCGKSTFAAKNFLSTEVVSSDRCRGIVSDDENNQAATKEAFDLLHYIVRQRLTLGKLTVVDATNVRQEDRKALVKIARDCLCLSAAIVFKIDKEICIARNEHRPDRSFGPRVVIRQHSEMRRGLKNLRYEGFRYIHILESEAEASAATIKRVPLWNNQKSEKGPFDIIGDVHGCYEELTELIGLLGYRIDDDGAARHPENRKLVFVGDLVDRGPDSPAVLNLVRRATSTGTAFCVPGNHDEKFLRYLKGAKVNISHGLARTIAQVEALADPEVFKNEAKEFLDSLVSHYVFADGQLVVAHAGIKEHMQGRASGMVREFCLYGETTGEKGHDGYPVRLDWSADYRGSASVVYGHVVVREAVWNNNTINIDTGVCFGGKLTALRWPEREIIEVPAREIYFESEKTEMLRDGTTESAGTTGSVEARDELLDIEDVTGKRFIDTALHPRITIQEGNAQAALEVMSRFAIDPRWIIYLPGTMSPCATSQRDNYLEHPDEALDYYRSNGVASVVCEEKHMGSRCVVVVGRDETIVRKRFGAQDKLGVCYTRTGRPFFDDENIESELMDRLRAALEESGLWEELESNWLCLDCELMPWSAKAQGLLRQQYAAVATAGDSYFAAAQQSIAGAVTENREELMALEQRLASGAGGVRKFRDTYRNYCWPVGGVEDLRLAPFHLLAGEKRTFFSLPHTWHMEMIGKLSAVSDPIFHATHVEKVDVNNQMDCERVINWWTGMTENGGEGMVVKPDQFITRGSKGLLQPAVKCRGREYLRIIYGPDYDRPENLARLKFRGLGRKRSLALREFALGVEALERFVREEPLFRYHECVFGVLALESEPVDPRL